MQGNLPMAAMLGSSCAGAVLLGDGGEVHIRGVPLRQRGAEGGRQQHQVLSKVLGLTLKVETNRVSATYATLCHFLLDLCICFQPVLHIVADCAVEDLCKLCIGHISARTCAAAWAASSNLAAATAFLINNIGARSCLSLFHSLGSFQRFEGQYSDMAFENGAGCWQGPSRSIKVPISSQFLPFVIASRSVMLFETYVGCWQGPSLQHQGALQLRVIMYRMLC